MVKVEDQEARILAENLRIFSGGSHPELAKQIASYLGCRVCQSTTQRFANDNLYVQLGESVRGKEVVIIQSFSPDVSDHLLEMLMMADAARSASAKTVWALIPYFSYARSDKKDAPRISITARLIADLLTTAGFSHVMTMELHSPQVHGFFRVPTDHLTAHPEFINHFSKGDLSNTVVVSPDIGHAKHAAKLARALGVPVAAADKERTADEHVTISEIIGEVTGKDAIVFDDEIATGGSIVAVVNKLREKGVRRISVACTHGVFCGPAFQRLAALQLDEIVTTNTMPMPRGECPPNMTVLSVAKLFGEAIKRNILGRSVGDLFSY